MLKESADFSSLENDDVLVFRVHIYKMIAFCAKNWVEEESRVFPNRTIIGAI